MTFLAMETLLPWQQANFAITQLYVSILSLIWHPLGQNVLLVYLVIMLTTVTIKTKNCALIQQHEKVF